MCAPPGLASGAPVRPAKLMPPVISIVVGLTVTTATAPRPVPVTAGKPACVPPRAAERIAVAAAYIPPPPPPYPPPPHDTTIPTRTEDATKPIEMFRMFATIISLRDACDAKSPPGNRRAEDS